MNQTYTIVLKIDRYDPETGRQWVQTYQLEVGGILRFVDLFRKINDEQDASLAWNSSCEHGQCGTCSVRVNGKPMLACELLVENAVAQFNTTTFTIKPLEVAPLVRDLVFDTEKAYTKIDQVKPYLIQPSSPPDDGQTNTILPEELEFYKNATRCINCFSCADACLSSHHNFLGPNAMLATIVRIMDPREMEKDDRVKTLYSQQGVSRCHSSMACSHVCPKEIDVAHFIALAKQGRFRV